MYRSLESIHFGEYATMCAVGLFLLERLTPDIKFVRKWRLTYFLFYSISFHSSSLDNYSLRNSEFITGLNIYLLQSTIFTGTRVHIHLCLFSNLKQY